MTRLSAEGALPVIMSIIRLKPTTTVTMTSKCAIISSKKSPPQTPLLWVLTVGVRHRTRCTLLVGQVY